MQEALHIQMTQEVYFLASNQCGLRISHAYLFDMIKEINQSIETKRLCY